MQDASTSSVDWAALRKDFPTAENFCYLNLANKAILPRSVEHSMQSWMNDIYENAGELAFSMDEIEKTREAVADLYGAPAECISLLKNTSEGVNIIAQGFPWQEGDILLLDNMSVSHAREPFEGNRDVVVCMTNAYDGGDPEETRYGAE